MSSSRTPSPEPLSPARPSSGRQTSIRLSSRSNRSSGGSQHSSRNVTLRTRPPTPVVSQRRRRNAGSTPPPTSSSSRGRFRSPPLEHSDDETSSLVVDDANNSASHHQHHHHHHQHRRRAGDPVGSRSHEYVLSSSANLGQPLAWYERLLPECVLAMSSPITGYETRLDSDVDQQEYEILERERLRRNRRIRRRLATLLLVAGAASAVMYLANGRLFRRAGVRAGVSTFKHRLEDGLSRTIHDTLGK